MCPGSQVRVCAIPSLPESDESQEGKGEETGRGSKEYQLLCSTAVSITKQTSPSNVASFPSLRSFPSMRSCGAKNLWDLHKKI